MSLQNRGANVLSDVYDTHVPNPLVEQNTFIRMPMADTPLPTFENSKDLLPDPFWQGHDQTIACYWKAWQLAFGNLRRPTPENGYVSNYIDTAFNNGVFMWDSSFILMFGRYGQRAFNFLGTLDNFYAKQHSDGFICREIDNVTGSDRFHRYDPPSTGPNIMGWIEWEYYLNFRDKQRLARVFPVLRAYHQWMRVYRTWPDGTYWYAGWCAMDNQPRMDSKQYPIHRGWSHGHMSWVDASLWQILSANTLMAMGCELGRQDEVADMRREGERLTRFVNERLWDDSTAYYYDRWRDGTLNGVKSVASYWALLADVVPKEHIARLVAHLENTEEFNRPHRVPSLSADHPEYDPKGGCWLGSVWPPTTYMVLRGLTHVGYDDLAHEIGRNHLKNVVEVFRKTGSLWENYAPDYTEQGNYSKRDFVGWTGLPPIAVLFEYVFGLRPDLPNGTLIWDVRLLEEHGVKRYPFAKDGLLDLRCPKRSSPTKKPDVEITSTVPVTIELRWQGGKETIRIQGN